VSDWLEGGLPGRSDRTRSIYREALRPLLEHIGTRPLRELTTRDVHRGLEALSDRMSTRYLQIARAFLARAIRYAEAHDLVGRNVATLVDNPEGQVGRPNWDHVDLDGDPSAARPCGRITTSSSPSAIGTPWTRPTSGASSARSPKQPVLARAGHRGTCATPSSP
jgi:Phage integrase central domain